MSGLRKLQNALYSARLGVEGNLRVRFPVNFRRAIISCACCFALAAVAAGLPDFDSLRARLQAGEHQAVLDELRSLEFDFAGEPEFDYLFGVSAIRAGEVNVGAFALERVLAVSPSHIGARFELAMSYVLLGNFEVGIKELEKLLARENLPESQRQIVLAHLSRIEGELRRREQAAAERERERYGFHGSVQTGLSYTDNVNYSPGSDVVLEAAPGFRPDELSPVPDLECSNNFCVFSPGPPIKGWFADTSAKLDYRHKLDEDDEAVFGFSLFSRDHERGHSRELGRGLIQRARESDFRIGDFHVELIHTAGGNRVNLRAAHNVINIGGDHDRDSTSLGIGWLHFVSERLAFRIGGDYALTRVVPENSADVDKNLTVGSLGAIWIPATKDKIIARLFLIYSDEHRLSESDDGDRKSAGVSAALSFTPRIFPRGTFTLSGSATRARYKNSRGVNPPISGFVCDVNVICRKREGKTYTVSLDLDYALEAKGWHLLPRVAFSRADSNFSDFEYDRIEGGISIRYEW